MGLRRVGLAFAVRIDKIIFIAIVYLIDNKRSVDRIVRLQTNWISCDRLTSDCRFAIRVEQNTPKIPHELLC